MHATTAKGNVSSFQFTVPWPQGNLKKRHRKRARHNGFWLFNLFGRLNSKPDKKEIDKKEKENEMNLMNYKNDVASKTKFSIGPVFLLC